MNTRPLSAGELDPEAPWCPGCGFANYSAGPCEVCGYDDQNMPPGCYFALAGYVKATREEIFGPDLIGDDT